MATLYLSTFTFGGGYVIVSLLKNKFVDELHWIDDDEMLDLVAIAQSSPGAIAVNGAIVVGYKIAGMPGVLAAVLGAVIPPFVILTVVSAFYNAFKSNFVVQSLLTGMKSGVSAVIISVVYDMGAGIVKDRKRIQIAVMIIAFILNYYLNVNVIYIILATALLGAAVTVASEKGNKNSGGGITAEREQNGDTSAGSGEKSAGRGGRT
ncbi:MAG: chromate transporter [Lachnospiraceae bacterium]|nr:chromate transporter [Lachnospiraceae bacterium]